MGISAAVLDAMVAAGCSAEQIAAAVKASLSEQEARAAEKRAKDAERQRRHRASRDVTVTDCDTAEQDVTEEGQKNVPPHPPIENKKPNPLPLQNPKADRRGSRLSADWQPSPEEVQWARSAGLPSNRIETVAAEFRDYWCAKPGAAGRKVDWSATWRNWVRKSLEWGGGRKGGSTAPPKRQAEKPSPISDDVWRREVARYVERRGLCQWAFQLLGPPPNDPGNRIPDHILAEFNLNRAA
jgi:hypothetical protein